VKEAAPGRVKKTAPKEGHTEEGHREESNGDLDCPTTNRKKRDSQSVGTPAMPRQYPRLKELLARYFMEPGQEKLYPSDRLVVDVVDAAGADEEAVMHCLGYLYYERGLRPGTRNGPRHWSWFVAVVADYFAKRRARDESANPRGNDALGSQDEQRQWNEQFGRMTDAIEIDPETWN
jgi:hypothetical protein